MIGLPAWQCADSWCRCTRRSRLLGMFLKEESNSGDYEGDEMEHFANVMTNVTQVIEGRTFLMEPGNKHQGPCCLLSHSV